MKMFYSSTSHGVLNHLTLHITDADIRKQYNEALAQNYDKLFGSSVAIAILYMLFRVITYFTSEDYPVVRLVTTGMQVGFVLVWGLTRIKFKLQAPKIVFLYAFAFLIQTNFSIRDQVPDWMYEPDKIADVDTLLFTLIIVDAVNYNHFMTTLLINPPLFLLSYYFQLK